jgi:Protein of unknown function (DUF3106)
MNRPRQACCRTAAIFAALQLAVFSLAAQTATNVPPQSRSSPDFFGQLRQLLAMPADGRENFLTNRPPEIRERILAKVAEYEALDPDERELRLRATELRWYLEPLLREPPTNRAAQLAQVPDDVRDLVQSRLQEWIILPPPLQQEFLDNERTLQYFGQVDPTNNAAILPDENSRKTAAQVNHFFELTPDEKQKTLNTLSDAERRQMEKTLQSFDKMPPDQRAECVNAFAKFASMDAWQRAEFLVNAARWSEMSPAERQAWRDLVVNVPQWPPLPPGFLPPAPTGTAPAVATNHN